MIEGRPKCRQSAVDKNHRFRTTPVGLLRCGLPHTRCKRNQHGNPFNKQKDNPSLLAYFQPLLIWQIAT
jgi:hypothetical protein